MTDLPIIKLEREHLRRGEDQARARREYDAAKRDAARDGRDPDIDLVAQHAARELEAATERWVVASRAHLNALAIARAERKDAEDGVSTP